MTLQIRATVNIVTELPITFGERFAMEVETGSGRFTCGSLNGNGDIDYDLTANMSDANYPASGEGGGDMSSYYSRIITHGGSTSSNVRVRATNSASYTTNQVFRFSSIIHGDLA